MIVIGLTGGIASGKNTVSMMLEEFGARVIDADLISRELVEPGKAAWREIVNAFGEDILNDGGEINRSKLGEIVFSDAGKMANLNSILHPKIIKEEWARVSRLEREEPEAVVVISAALLIESGNYNDVDLVVVIAANEETLLQRMGDRDKLPMNEALLRLKSQMPADEKRKYAQYVLENNGSVNELKGKVKKLYQELIKKQTSSSGKIKVDK